MSSKSQTETLLSFMKLIFTHVNLTWKFLWYTVQGRMGCYSSLGWLILFPFLNFPSYSAAAVDFTMHFKEVPFFSLFPVLKEKYILEFSMPKSAAYIPAFKQLRLKYSAYQNSATKCRRKIISRIYLHSSSVHLWRYYIPNYSRGRKIANFFHRTFQCKKYHVQLLGE